MRLTQAVAGMVSNRSVLVATRISSKGLLFGIGSISRFMTRPPEKSIGKPEIPESYRPCSIYRLYVSCANAGSSGRLTSRCFVLEIGRVGLRVRGPLETKWCIQSALGLAVVKPNREGMKNRNQKKRGSDVALNVYPYPLENTVVRMPMPASSRVESTRAVCQRTVTRKPSVTPLLTGLIAKVESLT